MGPKTKHAALNELAPGVSLTEFVTFVKSHLQGDEKGEAQIFCDRLFRAFGHQGIMEAGGTLEFRIHKSRGTRFADLIWRPRVLIEMKKRGERLEPQKCLRIVCKKFGARGHSESCGGAAWHN